MRKIGFFLLLNFFSCSSFAQEIIYEDTFDDKNESWVSIGNYGDRQFEYGHLILAGNAKDDMIAVFRNLVLDPAKDYSVSCSVRSGHGSSKESFGIALFDGRHMKKPIWYYVMLFPTDWFQVSVSDTFNVKMKEYLPKQKIPAVIKRPDEYNHLELKYTGGILEFYINDHSVWSQNDPDICITGIGFFTEGSREIYVDELFIKQDGWRDINLADVSLKKYAKENLGMNVNSASEEIMPIISSDGQMLYICVRGDTANTGTAEDTDIWYATLTGDNLWSKRTNIGWPLNNKSHNYVINVSPDNNTLLVGGRYDKSGNITGGGFSVSQRQKDGWSIPVPLNVDNYYTYSKKVSYAYSPSGKALIMSIERDDTFGKQDLYVSVRKDDDSWSEPLNMGPDLNTFGTEITPFLAADNTTLYFATNGRPGYGEFDIFLSRRLDDSWTSWSKPENLGPNINTTNWDGYFSIPASGDYTYLVSNDHSLGFGDIFRVKVAETARPNPVALIKGQVYDLKTLDFLEATITYFDLETNREIGTARSNPVDGAYKISLPAGYKYSYYAQKEGYFPVSENIDLTGLEAYTEITRDLYLAPMEVGQIIRLNNIFFEFDKSNLLPESVYELDRLTAMMDENPLMKIQIAGHTDNYGTDAYNQKLSEDRARAVYNFLKSKNLGSRVTSIGYGESVPVATNETDEGRAINRRVEFVILGK